MGSTYDSIDTPSLNRHVSFLNDTHDNSLVLHHASPITRQQDPLPSNLSTSDKRDMIDEPSDIYISRRYGIFSFRHIFLCWIIVFFKTIIDEVVTILCHHSTYMLNTSVSARQLKFWRNGGPGYRRFSAEHKWSSQHCH